MNVSRWTLVSGLTSCLILLLAAGGCQTTDRNHNRSENPQEPKTPPPPITAKMPLQEAIDIAIDFGGDTLRQVRLMIGRRGEWPKAEGILDRGLRDGIVTYDDPRLVNAVHLYQSSIMPANPDLFERMVSSDRPLAKRLAWQIATTMPSRIMAAAVERELTRALREDDEQNLFVPQMANAVAANRLKSSYTVLLQGLQSNGHENFAKAMISLDPARSTNDFLNYLSRATVDELRQISVTSVNVFAAMLMLRHMGKFPPTTDHPHFEHLFLYSISRNMGLSDAASSIILGYLPKNQDRLAIQLARQPAWVQIAYVEAVRRRLTPVMSLFLGELKHATAQQDVVDEISELRL